MEVQTGKISPTDFKQFIEHRCGKHRQEVIAGPQFGVDVSIVGLPNGMAMAMASDPLSLIPSLGLKESAWLSVQLAANDIATTGFPPMYGQFVLNLPATFSQKDFEAYWDYIHLFCSDLGIAITGGHTGFVEGNNSTIAGGVTFTTIAKQDLLLTTKSATVGDVILVSKGCAISSAAILAMSFPETAKNKAGAEHYNIACESFYDISVMKDALTAVGDRANNGITAMHDVTEGGVLGAIYEMAVASGNGAIIYNDQLPIRETQSRICEVFSIDPRYCIGAGAMVITCKKEAKAKIIAQFEANAIPCTEVGEITEKLKGVTLMEKETLSDLIYNEKDPYWGAFFNALHQNWK
ncbi:Thiamine-monophosphate kinase [Arenibacter antarcticus]|uniref:AIR synthase family protein n=1 Tax=Arenibacter antarcticus TaxID=2040469 RepID=A0ABW5VCK2_9FLAO|nr:AIR synthase family protein [Arenibacter sp. H213]MCM4167554.1 AIR synthase [Arenibacter sp. H213]